MSDRPTPRTEDAYDLAGAIGVFIDDLKHQRDEARENAKHWCDMHILAVKDFSQAQELARELRDALERVINHGHADDCFFLNRANGECDCGVDDASAIINKSREVLP